MCKGGCFKLHPIFLLVFLTLINILIYIDRGILSAVATTLESNDQGLGLNSVELGGIGSLFMLGYMIAGPIFAHYSQSVHPLSLMFIGLGLWEISVAGAGFSRSFLQLACARALSGVGEASFVCLAPPYILDHAPPSRKTTWIAIFYSALAIGFALGYILGNLISTAMGGWYWPFYIEAIVIFPFVLTCLLAKKENSTALKQETEEDAKVYGVCEQVKIFWNNRVFVFLVLGFTAFIFTLGGLGYWGPYIIEKLYNQSREASNLYLGVIVIATGISGTLTGSLLLDWKMAKHTALYDAGELAEDKLKSLTTEYANLFLFINTSVALAAGLAGILTNTLPFFLLGIAIAHFFIFL